jgi:hypothetical protein
MGSRYVIYRSSYELQKRSGLLKSKFPTKVIQKEYISLEGWKNLPPKFFFNSKEQLSFPKNKSEGLKALYENYCAGKFEFFGGQTFHLGKDFDWLTNPETQFKYDKNIHWTEIEDYSDRAGDIKFVWEKSRFGFLFDIIRFDYHFEQDCSAEVFKEIEDWIDKNEINKGPNYRCSQEISLRVFNWIFALYYYKNNSKLSEPLFQKIIHSIYWQMDHVYRNINFSRIAVRNNHAITETLMLYVFGTLCPFLPYADKWKKDGKKWFEEEIEYQIYSDGTFLQFSHNYHRVVIQLLTMALNFSEINNESFTHEVYDRAQKSLNYLYTCTNKENGMTPNYGANDGALFFKLNDATFRDYRPQLNALHYFFNRCPLFESERVLEDIHWLSGKLEKEASSKQSVLLPYFGKNDFPVGGYYTFRDKESFTFIRCGNHKDRPSQADNMHLDIWYKGQNIFHDCGSFKYNSTPDDLKYFMGSTSHNNVMIGEHDQMERGSRFIWYKWSQALEGSSSLTDESWTFKGKINAFKHLQKEITHQRKVVKHNNKPIWEIEDILDHKLNEPMRQHWHIHEKYLEWVEIIATDSKGKEIEKEVLDGFYSETYGKKESSKIIRFSSTGTMIKTKIQIL